MPTSIRLPVIAAGFEAGTLAAWHKAVGDFVEKGEVLFDVETDKAIVEVRADEFGVLGAIRIAAGTEDVPVDAVVGLLLKHGETAADLAGADGAPRAAPAAAGPASAGAAAVVREALMAATAPISPAGRAAATLPTASTSGRHFASPLARRVASQRGVDLAAITGRGPNGRILKADVEAAVGQAALRAASQAPAPAHVRKRSSGVDIPHSKIRRVIARRLTAAKQEIPHFYLSIDCELDALLDVRRQLNEHFARSGVKISINDCVVKAAALALVEVPAANASWSDDAIHQYGSVDIAVAVATDGGLMTPIVRDADLKSLAEISREMKQLAARAVAGKLQPDEFNGGGFSLSNLGMYGIKSFSAIINPPQSCILAVGAGDKRPVVRGDAVTIATVMTCTLSVDHRAVDGAVGAQLLGALKKYIESPALLLLRDA